MPPKTNETTSPAQKTSQLTSSAKPTLNLNPGGITLQTFQVLLSLYPATVTKLHRRRNRLKLKPKAKSAKRKAQDLDTTSEQEQDPALEERIEEETDKFVELDSWRYQEMPKIISRRRSKSTSKSKTQTQTQTKNKTMKGEEEEEEAVLDKEDLVRIMEWKLYVLMPSPLPPLHGVWSMYGVGLHWILTNNSQKTRPFQTYPYAID